MTPDYTDDPVAAEIASHLVLARWAKYDADPDLRDDQRLAMIAGDVTALTNTAAALRAITDTVASGSSPEALAVRVAAADAQKAADARRFHSRGQVIGSRLDVRKAAEDLDRQRTALTKAESAFERLSRDPGCPEGERLIAEGGLVLQRQRVQAAEAALADAEARKK